MDAAVTWDPARYSRFTDARLRPALDLLSRVSLDAPRRIYDLGCGTGDITRIIATRWPRAAVTGTDLSAEMLEVAAGEESRIGWEQIDVRAWKPPAPADLIYSNAMLHWVPDHDNLIRRLAGFLAPGGVLAIQMPLSWQEPSHRLMREVLATGGPGATPLGSAELRTRMGTQPVATPAYYHELLAPELNDIDIWETRYLQVLSGDDPVLEWVSGTALRPILEGLDQADLARFLEVYREKLRAAYPARPNGVTLFPFPRLFIVATRASTS